MNFRDWLARCPLVAILRGVRPEEAEAVTEGLAAHGIAIIEVPLNSPEPLTSIARLAARFGERLLVGAGTVMSEADVAAVAQAGGRLIVTPHASGDVVRAARRRGMLACPGFFTVTEAFAMLAVGADAIKLFPAEGSHPSVLRAMRAVLPPAALVLPVGGIEAGNMRPWLDAGAAGFGIGSSIYKPGDTAAQVGEKAAALVAGLRAERQGN